MMSTLIVPYYFNILVVIRFAMEHRPSRVVLTLLFSIECVDDRTIPMTVEGETDTSFRLTEDLTSYLNCRVRTRNKHLFTANQVK
jgi:hypothetical protein